MNKYLINLLLIPFWFLAPSLPAEQESTPQPVVYAVLFYSPYCGHCEMVITQSLPPLFEKYGEQLYIVGVDVSQADGQAMFMTVLQHFKLESGGVPFLVVGDTYLIGSADIPEKFPSLIEQYLAQGGVDWPAIPGLAEALATPQPSEAPTATVPQAATTPTIEELVPTITASPTGLISSTPASDPQTPTPGLVTNNDQTSGSGAKFSRDPLGNSLAVLILGVMVLSLGGAVCFFRRIPDNSVTSNALRDPRTWLIPILCLVGLAVSGYLAYVETTQVEAVCGPVGDCNAVQQSEYARLFGVFPIGILGMIGYLVILLAWVAGGSTRHSLAVFAKLALLGLTAFGVLFSIYLTFLEPFVIGATCAWCLTSAIIMVALFRLSLTPARVVLATLYNDKINHENL